jgi:hypothetical protein
MSIMERTKTRKRSYSIHTSRAELQKRIKIINGDTHASCPKCSWLGGPYTDERSAVSSLYTHIRTSHKQK